MCIPKGEVLVVNKQGDAALQLKADLTFKLLSGMS